MTIRLRESFFKWYNQNYIEAGFKSGNHCAGFPSITMKNKWEKYEKEGIFSKRSFLYNSNIRNSEKEG